jgi:D-3-phosphoglycerate dehydrogenase
VRRLAILNDHERQSQKLADWSDVASQCSIDVFHRPLEMPDEAASVLAPYEMICLVRERMAMPGALLRRLPKLRFIAATGPINRTIDLKAAEAQGIVVSYTAPRDLAIHATAELAWALILAVARRVASSDRAMRQGQWLSRTGHGMRGQCLGLLGLGRIGQCVARIGQAFGMQVIAWSENLRPGAAAAVGVQWVERDELFRMSDVLSLHVVLSDRTRGLVGAREISLMKQSSILINTARGPLIDEGALIDALTRGAIAGAGLDVFAQEPLPPGHALTSIPDVVLTPHLGFSTEEVFRGYFSDAVENLQAYLVGKPIRTQAVWL